MRLEIFIFCCCSGKDVNITFDISNALWGRVPLLFLIQCLFKMCFVQWLNPWIQRAVTQSAPRNTVRPTPLRSALPGDWKKKKDVFALISSRAAYLTEIWISLLCRFVSLEKTACQGSCQHTSCSSCLLLKPPSCPQTCAPSDSSCLQHFGKCVHNHLTATHNPVCHNNLQVGGREAPRSYINNTWPACLHYTS